MGCYYLFVLLAKNQGTLQMLTKKIKINLFKKAIDFLYFEKKKT